MKKKNDKKVKKEEFKHFCLYERQRIERYLKQQKSRQFIADKLERSKSSIHDEIVNNSVKGIYESKKAHHKAYAKRRNSKIQCLKVVTDHALRDFVETNIKDDQSPEGISGRLKNIESKRKNNTLSYVSTKAIYKFVYSVYGRQIEQHLYHKAVHKKGGPKRGNSNFVDGRISIEKRPKRVNQRREFGHWEGDFIVSGKGGKGSLLVLVERKTRYPLLKYLESRDTKTVNQSISGMISKLPIKSLTIDNDISFQKHEELSEMLSATVYFCHAFASHEKGTVENRNKAIRRYARKKSDLSKYDSDFFKMIEDKLQSRFMKCLKFKTPKEVFELELRKHDEKQQKTLLFSSASLIKKQEIISINKP